MADEPCHDEPELPPLGTFERVAADDALFREEKSKEEFVESVEGGSLRSLMEGNSSEAMLRACEGLNKAEQLEEGRRTTWSQLAASGDDVGIGRVVRRVVEELEAPHLKPSGIESRLNGGVPSACMGLLSLLRHLQREVAASGSGVS